MIYKFPLHDKILQKIFSETHFEYDDVKRPLEICKNKLNGQPLRCIGLPSGHGESTHFSHVSNVLICRGLLQQ